ncbi:cobalt-precorrin-6A reductase [Azospirillum sp. SYSU D00513]|uniref:cobalt-precorrin-6A reductase n=1 Tax=Azospirillum sp. SYSU D00513 TaxID=2812561 RepID=UPI001A958A39|nr:cobalt-precorrin-6A reductase [Azospirillum sp. SYSU D00513]
MKALILGGTTEAMALSRLLAGHAAVAATVSLAGRTKRPVLPPLPTRIGGFGGVEGLKAYLTEEGIRAVVDATHPFADGMSANAATACRALGLPLLVLTRDPWVPGPEDRWIGVPDMEAAAEAVRPLGPSIFLTVGRQELEPFEAVPEKNYLIRAVDPPDPMPALPNHRLLLDRGPFTLEGELALLDGHRIGALVSKNSGGRATEAKLAAARARGIPVVMVERPRGNGVPETHDPAEALRWLEGLAGHAGAL